MESAVPNMGVRLPRGAFREARVDLLGTCRSPACPCLRPYWPNNMNNLLDNEVVCRQLRTLLQRLNIVVSYTDILAPNAFVYLIQFRGPFSWKFSLIWALAYRGVI